jgi:hypothetical protein
MADGDPWSLDRIACQYVADNGATYRFRALEAYQAQAGLGWSASTDPTQTAMPRGFKPRRVLTYDANNHANRRTIVVGTDEAYQAIVPGTTTFIVQNPATDVTDTFTAYGKEGERHRGVELD